jgi:hypothetical protein
MTTNNTPLTQPDAQQPADEGLDSAICWALGDKPDTPKGSSTLMWVTLRHKETGKLSVGILTYHNGHVMPCSDQCDPPDCAIPHDPEEDGYCEEYEWYCWSDGYCEYCETEWVWSSNYVEIIAHAPVVKPDPFIVPNALSLL